MSLDTGGQPVSSFIADNFTHINKVNNKSNHYFWKCNICGDKPGSRGTQIQGQDNNLSKHLADGCPDALAKVRREAHTFILSKTCIISNLDTHTHGNELDAIPLVWTRKKLNACTDYPLTEAQQNQANSQLLQYVHITESRKLLNWHFKDGLFMPISHLLQLKIHFFVIL